MFLVSSCTCLRSIHWSQVLSWEWRWPQWVNSSWPSDTKWQHRSGSTRAQVMAHFLMAPGHYLNRCSLIICEVSWPSTEGNRVSQEILKISTGILDMNLRINTLRLQPHLPCANDMNDLRYFGPADQGRQSSLDVWRSHAVSTQNMNHFNNLSLWSQYGV